MTLDEPEMLGLLVTLSPLEAHAWTHAAARVRADGVHHITGCPYPCRMMCEYAQVIRGMEARGVEVPS